MKVIQVTDLHLGRQGELRFGADLHERLARCIAHINAHHADAALCVFTGDLTELGEPDAYADLRAALGVLSVPYRLLTGNHDKRANLVAAFPECGVDANGFLQSVHDAPDGRLLFLDTLAEGRVEGELCDKRLGWLNSRLKEAAGRSCCIFMHHPPVKLGLPQLDPLGLMEPERFLSLLRRHGNVAHIFFGTFTAMPLVRSRGFHFPRNAVCTCGSCSTSTNLPRSSSRPLRRTGSSSSTARVSSSMPAISSNLAYLFRQNG